VTRGKVAGAALLTAIVMMAAAAPALTANTPFRQFEGFENAPPMLPHVFDGGYELKRPFVYPIRIVDRRERQYAEDRQHPVPIRWFNGGVIASIDPSHGSWFPLGTDPLGRDVLARLLYGTRLSLGVAGIASTGALILGLLVGGAAGFCGGRTDSLLMAAADFVLVLPAIYVVLAFRAALPLVLTISQVFWTLSFVLMLAGWPVAARGVRAIVAAERTKEYAEAAYAAGAGPLRILLRHLLPATTGFLAFCAAMLFPAFVLTEATMSLVGLGFRVPAATWGTMLRDGWQGAAFADAPWLLAPALMIVVCVLSLHLISGADAPEGPQRGTFS
jgi:peptide/nickel transport system permease protein